MSTIDQILDLFSTHGGQAYFGEQVSQLEHALQAAWLGEKEGAAPALVAAALLHDIGHLLHGGPEDIASQGVDMRHEDIGEAWLEKHFGQEVSRPVQLHVAAKRYLCTTDPNYLAGLSPASVESFHLQGGTMSEAEVRLFEADPHFEDALRLRRWDDLAKVQHLETPQLDYFRPMLEGLLVAPGGR